MATAHTINGVQVKVRNPFGVWALAVVTLGIYSLIWYYKVNKEVRRSHDIDVDPAMTVLALLFGWVLIIPPYVAIYRTGRRIERAQFKSGLKDRISPVGSFLLGFLFGLNMIYMQSNLNKMWRAEGPVEPQLSPSATTAGQLPEPAADAPQPVLEERPAQNE
ncbi:MAG: DUF4234 domain-containing protein [Actinomycetota bacterium]